MENKIIACAVSMDVYAILKTMLLQKSLNNPTMKSSTLNSYIRGLVHTDLLGRGLITEKPPDVGSC